MARSLAAGLRVTTVPASPPRTAADVPWSELAAASALATLGLSVALILALALLVLRLRAEIDALLFWGGFAALLGLIGTLGGVGVMARSIEQAGSVSAAVAWSGVRVTLITTVFGLMVLGVSLLAWFGLRAGLRRVPAGG